MPNGQEFLDDMEFERSIGKMSDRELSEFTARQVYDVKIVVGNNTNNIEKNTNRIYKLEKKDRKWFGIIGLAGSFVGALIVVLIEHFA